MKSKALIVLLSLLFCIPLASESKVVIKGVDPSYANDRFTFYISDDPISNNPKVLAQCTVASDGKFSVSFDLAETVYSYIVLGIYKGFMYIEPNKEYNIQLPPKTEKTEADILNPFFEPTIFYVNVSNADPNELNTMIQKFDNVYEDYLANNFLALVRKAYRSGVDTVIELMEKPFVGSSNKYFNDYRYYQYAYLRHVAYQRDRQTVVQKYYEAKPVLYNNTAYTNLLNQLHKNYLSIEAATLNTDSLLFNQAYRTIFDPKASPTGDPLKEYIMLKALHDAFYEKIYPPDQLLVLLDSLSRFAAFPQSKRIALNIKSKVTALMENYSAPALALTTNDKKEVRFENFKGKFVYLNFSNSKNYTCRQDLELLKILYTKFGEVLEIVTVATDKNFDDMLKLANDRSYTWTIVHSNTQPDIIEKYQVRVFPTYFLINPEGNLVIANAPSPKEKFDEYFIEIWEAYRKNQVRIKSMGNNK